MRVAATVLMIGGLLAIATIASLWTARTQPASPSIRGTVLCRTTLPDSSQILIIASDRQEIGKRGVSWHQMSGATQSQVGPVGFVDSRADLADLAFTSTLSPNKSTMVICQDRPERFVVLHATAIGGKWVVSNFGSDEVKGRVAKQVAEEIKDAPRSMIGPLRSMGALWGP